MSLEQRFRDELRRLRELSAGFVVQHPRLAPLLQGEPADPAVERLFQGVAFQYALLHERLEDDFPEIITQLLHNLSPQALKPIPPATIIAFAPKQYLRQSQHIPAGTQIASVPLEGTTCLFTTTSPVELHPLSLVDAAFVQSAGKTAAIKLTLELHYLRLNEWQAEKLRFFLAGDYVTASTIYFLLQRHLREIEIASPQGSAAILPPSALTPTGFDEALFPASPERDFAGRLLQEYFILPEKFLFLELTHLDCWSDRGSGSIFEIIFHLESAPYLPLSITCDDFLLFATPAVNLFKEKAEPIVVEERAAEYVVQPKNTSSYLYSIDTVTGCLQGALKETQYRSSMLTADSAADLFQVSYRKNALHPGMEVAVRLCKGMELSSDVAEIVNIELTCTNGPLAKALGQGQVRSATDNSPDSADFSNVTRVTAEVLPGAGAGELWRFFSILCGSPMALESKKSFLEVLSQLVPDGNSDEAMAAAARHRVQGIRGIEVRGCDSVVKGVVVRGREVQLEVDGDCFSSTGDLFIFCSIIDRFLAHFVTQSSFTRLYVRETHEAQVFCWPARMGHQPVI